MKTIYSERNWIKDAKVHDGSIHTAIDEFIRKESAGVTSIPNSTTGMPEEIEIKEYTASISFVRAGGAFSSSFIINDDTEKEAAMKALSTIIRDIESLRNEIIKLQL